MIDESVWRLANPAIGDRVNPAAMTDVDYEDNPAPWWRHAAQRWVLAVLDWCEYRAGRALCKLFDRHGKSCRGRRDHLPPAEPPGLGLQVLLVTSDGTGAGTRIELGGVPLLDVVSLELRMAADEIAHATVVFEVAPYVAVPARPIWQSTPLAAGGIVRDGRWVEVEPDEVFIPTSSTTGRRPDLVSEVIARRCPAGCGHLHEPLSAGTGGRCPFCSCVWRSTL